MKRFLFGLLCGVAVGCTETTPPVTGNNSAGERPTTVTANRPTTDGSMTTSGPTDRNNSGVNVRDRGGATKTPLDQNENKTDVKITADIRKQVVAGKMSVDAQNVKIITQDGKVTLRGPVKSDDEKASIEKIAVNVAGADRVDNQLEVALK